MALLIDPLVSFDLIDRDELNWCLTKWDHRMGENRRPTAYGAWDYGLRHNGVLVAVTSADTLIRETCAGILLRSEAVELSRVCAARRDLCRVAVRLWREFVFPALCESRGFAWAVSYQDAALHSGDLYRFDGWVRLVKASSSTTDPRTGRAGRERWVWGWHADPAERALRLGLAPTYLKDNADAA